MEEKGENPEFIHHLAQDAQQWTKLRDILRGQLETIRSSAVEHCRRYNENEGIKDIQKAIDDFTDEVNGRISQLDQIVRDLLQIVSMLTIISNNYVLTLCRNLLGSRWVSAKTP